MAHIHCLPICDLGRLWNSHVWSLHTPKDPQLRRLSLHIRLVRHSHGSGYHAFEDRQRLCFKLVRVEGLE